MRGLRRSPTARVVIALVAGLVIGVLISVSGDPALRAIAAAMEPVGTMWINALRMTVIPLVVSLLVASVGRFADIRSAGRTGGRALLLFAALLIGSAVFAVLTVPTLFRRSPTGEQTAAALSQAPTSSALREQLQHLPTVTQWLADLVPINPIRAAADGEVNKRPLPTPLGFSCRMSAIARAIRQQAANSGHTQPLPNLLHCGHSTPGGLPSQALDPLGLPRRFDTAMGSALRRIFGAATRIRSDSLETC